MELVEILKGFREDVDSEIEKVLPRDFSGHLEKFFGRARWSYDVGAINGAIARPAWDLLDRGGKRWRPFLMKLCFEAVGGKGKVDRFFPLSEVIHNGTLIVDDFEDGSDLRRGKSCVHKIYGDDLAINAGNAMYFLPMVSLIRDGELEVFIKVKIYEMIHEEMIKLSFGQGMDIFWHQGSGKSGLRSRVPSEEEYLQMCAFKTGTLARMAAKLGGILGKADEKIVEALGNFAESLGVAFQIQDDILNICPGEDWGKDFGDDISEGKRTLLVIRALEVLGKEDSKDLIGILNMKTKNKVILGEAIGLIKNSGAVEYASLLSKNLVREAWEKLEEVLGDSDAKEKLEMFCKYVVEREL